jgi:hypothetical protein
MEGERGATNEQLNHLVKEMLKWTYYWIMHYNIISGAGKNFFYLEKMIHCKDGDETEIPKPIRDGDLIMIKLFSLIVSICCNVYLYNVPSVSNLSFNYF